MFVNTPRSPFLPEDYIVGPQHVIIGRGKRCKNNPGNQRFKAIIQQTLQIYSTAATKLTKSATIMQVLNFVRDEDGIGFVKRDAATGRYTRVEEASSRIAIAQAFRDALDGIYKSSKKNKQTRRLKRLNSNEEAPEAVSRSMFEESFEPLPLTFHRLQASRTTESSSCVGLARSSSEFSMMQLRSILNEATSAGATTAVATRPNITASPQVDVFSNLYTAFGSQIGDINTEDPFEPRPIADNCNTSSIHLL